MTEIVLNSRALPEPLCHMIHTEKVRVCDLHGEIRLIPIGETDLDCPLLGIFADGKISAEKFMAGKQVEKEFEL